MKTNDLVLVIDVQNVYMEGQPWACQHTSEAITNIKKIIKKADEQKNRVIFTRFIADDNARFGWKKYNEINREVNENPWMNEIADDLKTAAGTHEIYDKSVYSALAVPAVRQACFDASEKGGRIILTGVVDDCCVLSTFFAALDDGAELVWIKDAIAGINEEKHHSAEVVVEGLAYCHCSLVNTEDYLKED